MAMPQDFRKDLDLFVECGLIAIKQGDEEGAKRLFAAARVLDPENTVGEIGFGLIAMHKLELKVAQTTFEKVLAKENNYRAKAFLSLVHMISAIKDKGGTDSQIEHMKKAGELAADVVKNSNTESPKALAQTVLDWEKEIASKSVRA